MSALAFRSSKSRREATLNVTPLIDVLFLLIIFFTLTSTFKRAGEMELELPESSTSAAAADDVSHAVELTLTVDGGIRIDGEAVAAEEVPRRLAAARAEDAERRAVLQAEAGVPHGDVVHWLDAVRDAGFPGVSISTWRADSPGGP